MIDIHSHILPGIDDGAVSLDESLQMARNAAQGGTQVVFATPHVSTVMELQYAGTIAARVEDLQAHLMAAEIPITLVPGAEVAPFDGVIPALDAGEPILLGPSGKYLLIDSPFYMFPLGFEQLVFTLQTRGITPILAHPERVAPVQENPRMLEALVQRGMLLQVTASSLLGRFGEEARQTAELLLQHQWVHFIASDAHSPRSNRAGIGGALTALTELVGEETTTLLTRTNGQRVLDGEPVPTNPLPYAPPVKKKSWWGWWKRDEATSRR